MAFASRCASGSLNKVADAPARLSALPNFAMPTSLYNFGACDVRIFVGSPTFNFALSALCLSMTISSFVEGGLPSMRWKDAS